MGKKSLRRWSISLLLGGVIAVAVHLLVLPGLELTVLNALVFSVAARLSFEVPDLLWSPATGTFDARSGYGAAILAVVLAFVATNVSVEEASQEGVAVLVFGVGVTMWLYGVWFERSREHSPEARSD